MDMTPHGFRRPAEPAPPTLVDNPFAPEILATGFAGIANIGGIVTLTLESARYDHSRPNPQVERVVVGRVSMPMPVAQALVMTLNGFLEQQGFSPSKAAACEATFQ
jgi:hypothetical protein